MVNFPNLEELLFKIYNLTKENKIDEDILKQLKREYAGKYKLSQLPTNIQLLKLYNLLVSEGKLSKNEKLENLLRKRKIRSLSGIVPVQVLMKPRYCPGKCIFCPNDLSMPKSYINTEPGAMRALLNKFDPIKQVYNRLLSLTLTGHPTDKIEMIVLGGTFDAYPYDYKIEFIKGLYDACNTFDEFLKKVKINETNPKAARFTIEDDLGIKYSKSLEEAQKINETSNHRIIGLTIETRPEYVIDENCRFWRKLGVTRIEIGVQSLYDDVLEANKRGHNVDQIAKAFNKLRQYGFKISAHFMPGLYKSNVEKDIGTMKIAYSNKYFKPDEIKFYPTAVIPNTELFELYKKGYYKPLTEEQLKFIINEIKDKIIPPYTRIKRLVRDIPSTEIVTGANITNLRQFVLNDRLNRFKKDENKRRSFYERIWKNLFGLENVESFEKIDFFSDKFKKFLLSNVSDDQILTYLFLFGLTDEEYESFLNSDLYKFNRSFVCLCTRCREIRNKKENLFNDINAKLSLILVIRKYISSVGEEYFISFEDVLGYLYGFTRLLLPREENTVDREGLGKKTAIIRELHVYGQQAKIGEEGPIQHKGFGRKLMKIAELISLYKGYDKLSVISGVGVRKYYEKLGYKLIGTYMVKNLK